MQCPKVVPPRASPSRLRTCFEWGTENSKVPMINWSRSFDTGGGCIWGVGWRRKTYTHAGQHVVGWRVLAGGIIIRGSMTLPIKVPGTCEIPQEFTSGTSLPVSMRYFRPNLGTKPRVQVVASSFGVVCVSVVGTTGTALRRQGRSSTQLNSHISSLALACLHRQQTGNIPRGREMR